MVKVSLIYANRTKQNTRKMTEMMKTPFEVGIKGDLNVMSGRGGLPAETKPYCVAISRRGGDCGAPGMNKMWAAERIAQAFPGLGAFRTRLLAEGVEIRGGVAVAFRRIELRRGSGFPTLRLNPAAGWSRLGEIAGPKGKLP